MYRPVFYFIIHKLKFAYKSQLYRNNTASKKFLSPQKVSFVPEYRNIVRSIFLRRYLFLLFGIIRVGSKTDSRFAPVLLRGYIIFFPPNPFLMKKLVRGTSFSISFFFASNKSSLSLILRESLQPTKLSL